MEVEAKRPAGANLKSGFQGQLRDLNVQTERWSKFIFIMPSVLALLFLSIFPLIASIYLSLTIFKFVKGGFQLRFVGLNNYKDLLFGSDQTSFLGLLAPMTPVRWVFLGAMIAAVVFFVIRNVIRSGLTIGGLFGRIILLAGLSGLLWLLVRTLGPGGRLGTLSVTLVYVFVGIALQYLLGLGLALLTSQDLRGRRFFRVVFLLPMMITPVGVAYMFKMVTDTSMGPLTPLWRGLGLANFAWINDPWAARAAIILADTWQWVPFMFIVLLAAIESQPTDIVEAATVDGANSWQIFRSITWPGIFPISLTLVLIRMIEAFKIIDLPNVMTGGAPGSATESLTLRAFINWRALDLGSSAAVAYLLLIVVTFFAVAFVQTIRQRSLGNE